MAAIAQIIANRLNAQKSTSPRSLSMSLGNPADSFMQNKPNFQDVQMNVTSILTKDYENVHLLGRRKNKANSNPIQTQSNPIQSQFKPNSKPIKPNQTQFQTSSWRCHTEKIIVYNPLPHY